MTEPTAPAPTQIGVQLRYRLPGASADIDLLFVSTADKAEHVRALLAGELEQEPVVDAAPLAPAAMALINALHRIQAQLDEDEARMEDGGIHNPIAGTNIASTCRIEDLRALGSSPKQVALLLACNTGFYNTDNNPEIFFSRRRFAPAPNFYDLALEGVSA